jgi:hypothetical protein
MKLANGVG